MRNHPVLVVCLALAACQGDQPAEPPATPDHSLHGGRHPTTASLGPSDLVRLRQVTAPFHNMKQAEAAGWNAQITDCFSSAAGGMGYHYGNPALIDNKVAVHEPELLLYEPQKNGQLRLVAVEYIVPRPLWEGEDPPQLYGQTFGENEDFDLYTLHVWIWQHNESGTFADWNPGISCQYATD
jgi:hypothetical protein